MKRVILLQARVNSTRLRGKVLLDLAGAPLLRRMIERLQRCGHVDEIVVATSVDRADDPLIPLADACGVRWYRGDEHDVLRRMTLAAKEARADVAVRVTGDCPLIDPLTTDRVIADLVEHTNSTDYSSNVIRRTYPRGLDTEAMFIDVLERMDRLAQSTPAREHVTVYLRGERRDLFAVRDVIDDEDNSDLRWTVDTNDDLELLRVLFTDLQLATRDVSYRELLAYVRSRPQLMHLNRESTTWSPT